MRASLLVCIFALGALVALGQQQQHVQPFQGGRTYTYRFRTQVASSLIGGQTPSETPEQAITSLQAQVRLTFNNEHHAKMQLQQIRMGELNGEQHNAQLSQKQLLIPTEQFERRQLPDEIKQKLELPLSVKLVDGVVERINFHDEEESVWSMNIKRAVLNLLQLNLKRNDIQGLKMESSMLVDEEQQKKLNVFAIPEITLEGECEVVYTIQRPQQGKRYYESNEEEQQQQQQQQQQFSSNTRFNVTKNVNFDKCQRTADISYGFQPNAAQELQCLKCLRQSAVQKTPTVAQVGTNVQQEQLKITQCQSECQTNQLNHGQDIERSTVMRYELLGAPQRYAIRRAEVISQYVAKAQNPAAQNTISQVVAISELLYKPDQQDNSQVADFKQSTKDDILLYSAEWDVQERRFYMFGDEEFDMKRSPFAKVQKKEQEATHAIREIIKQWAQDKELGYELNSALLFNKLVQVVRQSTTQELKTIEQAVQSISGDQQDDGKKSEDHAKALFHDALAVAATRNSLHMLVQKIKQKQISTAKAAELLKVFVANQHSPSDRQADLLERIADNELTQQCPILKQTAWLGFGAAVGRICQQQPSQSQQDEFRVETLCPEGKKENYKKALILQWKQAESVYDQILALKTIGNSALDKCMPELEKIIKDKRQPTLIRMEAIDALRRLRTSIPERIQQTLLPVFQDQRDQPEVRMAAVSMLLYTQPEPVILDQIVFSVQQDRSLNVRSFVLTALNALSKSPSSAEQQVAQHLKSAMKIVKISAEQMRPSMKYRVPIYVSEQQSTEEQNVFIGLASIVSPSNLFPVHMAASLRSAFNGDATQEKLQLSFTQKDLEQLYEKLSNVFERYNYNGEEGDDQSKESGERQSAKDMRTIHTSLGIKSRRTGSYYLSSEENDESSESAKRSTKLGNKAPFGMIVIRSNDIDQMIVPIDEQKLPQVLRKFVNGEQISEESFGETYASMKQALSRGQHFRHHVAMSIAETKTKLPTTSGLPLAVIWQTSGVASAEGQVKMELHPLKGRATADIKIRASAIATHLHKTEVWTPILVSGVQTHRTVEANSGPAKMEIKIEPTQMEIVFEPPKEQKDRILGLHTLPATYTQRFKWESRTYGEPRLRTIHNIPLEFTQREYHLSDQNQHQSAIRVEGNVHQVRTLKQLVNILYTTENNMHIYYKPSQHTPTQLTARISGFLFQRAGEGEHSAPDFDDFYTPSGSDQHQRKHFRSLHEEQNDDDSDEENDKHYRQSMSFADNNQRKSKLTSFVQKFFDGKAAAYKHKVKVELEARCPAKMYRAEMALQGQCDKHLQHCTATLNAHRSPIGDESEQWHLQAKVQTVAPENVRNEEEPDQKHSRMLVKANAEWGNNSGKSNSVHLRLQGEPTRKTYWRSDSDSSDKWSRFLNKFDVVANYQLRPTTKHTIQRFYELFKAYNFWQMSVNPERKGDPNTIHASLIIDPITRRHANLTIETPEERVRAEMIELPFKLQAMPLGRRPTSYQSIGNVFQSFAQSTNSECKANDYRVKTFDGVKYKAPMSECWTVLAKDCSRENPRFVVLMKKSEDEKRIKIMTQEDTIELQKKTDQQQIVVKVNGEQMQDQQKLSSRYGVEKSDYEMEVNQKGVSVRFDGEEAVIRLSGVYKNVQCGLCGHHSDDNQEDVFRTSGNRRSNNLKEFHQSYTLKNQDCDNTRLNKFYADKDSSEFQVRPRKQNSRQSMYSQDQQDEQDDSSDESKLWSSEEKGENQKIKPVDSTKVLEYEHKLCFSQKPVKRCPQGSSPSDESAESKQVKMQFFCLDRSSSTARRLQRKARRGEVIDSEGHKLSFFDTVQEPLKCQRTEEVY